MGPDWIRMHQILWIQIRIQSIRINITALFFGVMLAHSVTVSFSQILQSILSWLFRSVWHPGTAPLLPLRWHGESLPHLCLAHPPLRRQGQRERDSARNCALLDWQSGDQLQFWALLVERGVYKLCRGEGCRAVKREPYQTPPLSS